MRKPARKPTRRGYALACTLLVSAIVVTFYLGVVLKLSILVKSAITMAIGAGTILAVHRPYQRTGSTPRAERGSSDFSYAHRDDPLTEEELAAMAYVEKPKPPRQRPWWRRGKRSEPVH